MSKKKSARQNESAERLRSLERETLPFPFPVNSGGFTPEQVTNTADHLLAIPRWVPNERVISVVLELLEMVVAEDAVLDGSRLGDDTEAARYALLAVRLIYSYDLVLSEATNVRTAIDLALSTTIP